MKKKPELFTQHVTFTIQPSVWAQVKEVAQTRTVQPSSIIRMAISEWLSRNGGK